MSQYIILIHISLLHFLRYKVFALIFIFLIQYYIIFLLEKQRGFPGRSVTDRVYAACKGAPSPAARGNLKQKGLVKLWKILSSGLTPAILFPDRFPDGAAAGRARVEADSTRRRLVSSRKIRAGAPRRRARVPCGLKSLASPPRSPPRETAPPPPRARRRREEGAGGRAAWGAF